MWMRSKQVGESYDRLMELVILENFMGKLEPELQAYLVDKHTTAAVEAAVYADDYGLFRSQLRDKSNFIPKAVPNPPSSTFQTPPHVLQIPKPTNLKNKVTDVPQKYTLTFPTFPMPSNMPSTCNYCHKVGHSAEKSWNRLRKPYNLVCGQSQGPSYFDSHVLTGSPCAPLNENVVSAEGDGMGWLMWRPLFRG